MTGNAQREMPRYQSHKVVHALKLRKVDRLARPRMVLFCPADPEYAVIEVPVEDELAKREQSGQQGDPGYLVVYPDGFRSWSPTKAFEEGYTRMRSPA